ncbi:MAG: hypothetical protein ACN6OP_15275 [Pseudomonadales bacterium]|jgi:hypothetical protein
MNLRPPLLLRELAVVVAVPLVAGARVEPILAPVATVTVGVADLVASL